MQVRGQIRNDYIYIVPIRVSNDLNPTGEGPIPVVQFPTNNGFVGGNANYFVRWTPESRQYTLFRFTDTTLNFFVASGVPLNSVDVNPGSNEIGFELSLDQLVTNPANVAGLQSVQINFLTMNRLLDASSGSNRFFDALGDTRSLIDLNQPVRIPLNTAGIYDNNRFNLLEPPDADVVDPDLDIVNWSVEVRRQ